MSREREYTDAEIAQAKGLRAQGLTYSEITRRMGYTSAGIPWRLVNREQYNSNIRESCRRHNKRGGKPLWNGDDE
jgi:hypothetical protein